MEARLVKEHGQSVFKVGVADQHYMTAVENYDMADECSDVWADFEIVE